MNKSDQKNWRIHPRTILVLTLIVRTLSALLMIGRFLIDLKNPPLI